MRKLCLVIALVVALPLAAETLDQFDKKLEQQLQALDPGAVAVWLDANRARATNHHADAVRLYAAVYRRVPEFVHALRRQAGEELELGQRVQANEHARQAMAADRSSENLATVALILLSGETARRQAEIDEARSLANEAVGKNPRDSFANSVLAEAAIASKDLDLLRKATQQLEVVAPNEVATQVFRHIVLASEGNWTEAHQALDRARQLGLPANAYNDMVHRLDSATPFYVRWWKPALMGLAAWLAGFAFLLLAGAILSAIALRAARQAPSELSENANGLGSVVRRLYSGVLFLSCAFYYASIPLVIVMVIAAGGGLIYAFFAMGRVPIKIVAIVGCVMVVSVWSMLKSLFVRTHDEDPGLKLDMRFQPRLRAALDEVAKKIGTRAVDSVYLTPGTEVAVMERGKRSTRERCLILGIAALDALAVRPFKAVLGHEYGHFSNRDTAGGSFALAVRRSLSATAYGIATGGAAAWYNPAWLFVNGFHRVFVRISHGASRLQEVLADRWAVFAFGAEAFEQGLRSVIERTVRFDAHVGATLKEVVNRQLPLANLYTYEPSTPAADVTSKINEAINRKASAYDSHPSPAERFALVRALPKPDLIRAIDDHASAWSLFANAEELQKKMTERVRANVMANYGVKIAATS